MPGQEQVMPLFSRVRSFPRKATLNEKKKTDAKAMNIGLNPLYAETDYIHKSHQKVYKSQTKNFNDIHNNTVNRKKQRFPRS